MSTITYNCTLLREAQQCLVQSRLSPEQQLKIAPILDTMGFSALDVWGGNTLYASLKYFNRHPFELLDKLKAAAPRTPFMMTLRGQYLLSRSPLPNDEVKAFIPVAARHGIDIFRIFDPLNDCQNLQTAIQAVKAAGKSAHAAICYACSPVHTMAYYSGIAHRMAEMGADAIDIIDATGLMSPDELTAITYAVKKATGLPVWVSAHDSIGRGAAVYEACVQAGADAIDVSVPPFAGGAAHPSLFDMDAGLRSTGRAPQLSEATKSGYITLSKLLQPMFESLAEHHYTIDENTMRDMRKYHLSAGSLSFMRDMLNEWNMSDKEADVICEIPVVREAIGWVPMVYPLAWIVILQAGLNVRHGRWKQFSTSSQELIIGLYGQPPAPVNAKVQELSAEGTPYAYFPLTGHISETLCPGMPSIRKKLIAKGIPVSEENCAIYAILPKELEDYYANTSPQDRPTFEAKGKTTSPFVRQTPLPTFQMKKPEPRPESAAKSPAALPSFKMKDTAQRPAPTTVPPASLPSFKKKEPAQQPAPTTEPPASLPSFKMKKTASRPAQQAALPSFKMKKTPPRP